VLSLSVPRRFENGDASVTHSITTSSFKKFVMIVVKINQIIGDWIRSTAERLIAANAAGIVVSHSFCLGLAPEDIAALRGAASPPAEVTMTQGLEAPSKDSSAKRISPPIAGLLDAASGRYAAP
jgi:hypothetical protein